ncbi:VTT domain-containing protein [Halalkalicoccus sp. NIPERK01]|uniref:VTT domain-containing protein n=1 Tax=Halalkalicoccus sp. NIPERK01 TaxID=3053469 RepID=UPI00256F6033|nr:VTT domain-containing protein [Halalkalicoccus sp. NIPERK01]MDL5361753.1 VTT domain-containing protein [Halalkalicoccus sp. NIPERK01]
MDGAPVLAFVTSPDRVVAFAEALIALASGWFGLGIVFAYSFVLGFAVVPLPSELVLFAPLDLGFSPTGRLAIIVVVSGLGKAVGSVLVLWISVSVRESDPVQKAIENSRFRIHEWSRKASIRMARRYGYLGMAIVLSIPFFPDTASVYAFSVLEDDYLRFSVAAFAGSVGRLVVVALFLEGTIGL